MPETSEEFQRAVLGSPPGAEYEVEVRHPAIVRFGRYEIRPSTQELFKHGLRLKLPRQAFQVLHILLRHRGQLVTREELQQALWTSGTFVDFEHGLNSIINEDSRCA